MQGLSQGFLLLMRQDEREQRTDEARALLVSVGGDALAGIVFEVQGRSGERPLALDLLWRVLTRGREISRKHVSEGKAWQAGSIAAVQMLRATVGGQVPGLHLHGRRPHGLRPLEPSPHTRARTVVNPARGDRGDAGQHLPGTRLVRRIAPRGPNVGC